MTQSTGFNDNLASNKFSDSADDHTAIESFLERTPVVSLVTLCFTLAQRPKTLKLIVYSGLMNRVLSCPYGTAAV
jgi:hypothetical protein